MIAAWTYVSGRQCKVSNFVVDNQNEAVTTINGQAANFYHSENVKMLDIGSQTVRYFPKGLEKIFPNLEGIAIYNSKLKKISKSDLKPFPALRELYLHDNELETLDSDLFEFNPELRLIYLNSNKLKQIGANIFDSLTKLEQVYLNSNPCINREITSHSEIPSLKAEIIEKCPLPKQQSQEIASLTIQKQIPQSEIEILRSENAALKESLNKWKSKFEACDGNLNAATKQIYLKRQQKNLKIESADIELTCEVTGTECAARELKTGGSKPAITRIRNSANETVATENIEKLSIVDQQTFFLPGNLGEHFPELRELSIVSSGLFELEAIAFRNMEKLASLSLQDNKIYEVPAGAFAELSSLIDLDLSFNKIENILAGAFRGLASLENLNLGGNALAAISSGMFEGLQNLKELLIHENKLNAIAVDFSKVFPQALTIDLSDNECIDMRFPNQSLEMIREKIISSCIAPVEISCHRSEEEIFLSEAKSVSGSSCKAFNLIVEHPNMKLANFKEQSDVAIFMSVDQTMKFFPRGFAQMFPQLQTIVVDRSQLTSIDRQDFKDFAALTTLAMRHNAELELGEEVFHDLLLLEYVDLSHNGIQKLPPTIFAQQSKLKTLIIAHNRLTILTAEILPRPNAIEEFDASNNKLGEIETMLVKNLVKAKIVNFKSNSCIDQKLQNAGNDRKTFYDFYLDVNLQCCQRNCGVLKQHLLMLEEISMLKIILSLFFLNNQNAL